ncbi:MAG: electron transport complex subunit RsxC [Clostridia bacterium]|nr:electron transport complex subunit RsxC [Clostridia bacterium]
MKRFFHGGIHLPGRKELAGNGAPTPAPIPKEVILPLHQHIGVPCKPLVSAGDPVWMGQKIGDGEGLCVPVHASVSGRVIAVEKRPVPAGGEALCIVIENDGLDTPARELHKNDAPLRMPAAELLAIIREAGIVGMGGAGFPTNIKAAVEGGIGMLIVNACECEPYITADDALLCSCPERVLKGLAVLSRILHAEHAVLAVEDNKPDAIAAIRKELRQDVVKLCILPARYPQGAERQLIRAVTGREVPIGKLPKDVGCAVFNAATCAAVCDAVYDGEPLIRRIVSVTGEGIKTPKNYSVRIGTPFSVLTEAAGGFLAEEVTVIAGGPMMGIAQSTLDVPVTKGIGAILCRRVEKRQRAAVCIRCGKCVAVCPMNLMPLYLYQGAEEGDAQALERFRLSDCIECGCCSYTCPVSLPLTERFRGAKSAVKEGQKT